MIYFIAGKIGLFYLVFYGILAALVAICFWGFFQTLDPRIPRWQLERSIIGTNPGINIYWIEYIRLIVEIKYLTKLLILLYLNDTDIRLMKIFM